METLQNSSYLFAAYAIVWVVMFLYLFSISAREKKIARAIRDLSRRLAETGDARHD